MSDKPQHSDECRYPLDRLVDVMAELRGDNGCPWDKEQTHQSIKRYLIEETYEVLEALDSGDAGKVCDELGDILLQVVFHAQMAAEEKQFNMNDVINAVTKKMIRRHPHVFGSSSAKNSDEVLVNWDKIKDEEQTGPGETQSLLDNVPRGLPALMRAAKLQTKASRVGFDWLDYKGALEKVNEELKELYAAIESGNDNEVTAELGDIIFALVNVARFLKVDAEGALAATNERFTRRFQYIEQRAGEQGKNLPEMSLKEMDYLWCQAKCLEKTEKGKK